METIEQKAHEAYKANRELKEKYQIEESSWIDWFKKGYQSGQSDMKEKALEAFMNGAEAYDDFERDLVEIN